MQSNEIPEVVFADAPFHENSGGDIIFRSSDNVDFCISKFILSLSSPFFDSMLNLPQPPAPAEAASQGPLRGVPIVPVEEDRHALYLLLRTCYPVRAPPLSASMTDLRLALRVARKYDVDVLLGLAEEALVSMLHSHPVNVYALASCYQLDDLVKRSAIATRKLHLRDLHCEDLHLIDGKQGNALIQYHRRCGDAACQITANWSWLTTFPSALFLTGGEWALQSSCGCHPIDNTYKISTNVGMNCKGTHWWRRYIDMSKAALAMRPCGEAVLDEALLSSILADARACRACKTKIDANPDCLKNEFLSKINSIFDRSHLFCKVAFARTFKDFGGRYRQSVLRILS